MKKIILSILGVVFCSVALIVFMIIRSFNVDNYREQVITSLAHLTGKRVEDIKINGDSSLTWKPTPTFVMNQLTVANQAEGSEATMVQIDQVQVEMEWTSFFKSPLVIQRIILKNPQVLVERKYSYQTNFSFPVLFQLNRQNNSDGLVKDLDLSSIRIDELQIENGTLRFKNLLTQNEFSFTQINGVGRADSLDGPYAFDGTATYHQQMFLIDVKTGQMQISSPLRINIKLTEKGTKSWIDLSADLNQDSKDKWFVGGGSFLLENPRAILPIVGLNDWYQEGTLSGSYKVNVSSKRIDFQDVVLSQRKGEEVLFSCVFDLVNDYNEKKTSLYIKDLSMKEWQRKLWQNIWKSFPLTKVKNELDIQVQAANMIPSVGDTKLTLSAQSNQGLMNGEMVMTYPNDTSFSFKGQYHIGKNHLTGQASFGSANVQGLMTALSGLNSQYLPKENLKNVHLEGQLDLSDKAYQYTIAKGTIDETTLSGKVAYFPQNQQWQTDLKLQGLDLDKYGLDTEGWGAKLSDFIFGRSGQKPPFIQGQYQVGITAEKVRWLGSDYANIQLYGALGPDTWDISSLVLRQSEENHLTFKGKISHYARPEVAFVGAEIGGTLSDYNLVQKWGFTLPEWLTKNHDRLGGTVQYNGTLSSGTLTTQLKADNAELIFDGQIQNLFTQPEIVQSEVHFKYPNLSHLARLLDGEKTRFEKRPVFIEFQGTVATSKGAIQWQDGILYLGDDRLNTQGSLTLSPFQMKADIKATRLNADIFIPEILSEIYSEENGFQLKSGKDFSLNLTVLADAFQYQDFQAQNLKSQFSMENQSFNLKEFSVNFSQNPHSLLSLTMQGQGENGSLSVAGKVQVKEMPVPAQLFPMGNYRLGEGVFSSEFDFSAAGNTYENLRHSLSFQGPFSWNKAVLEGVDVVAWQEAVESALKMAQITAGFNSRLEFAFKNGQTELPPLSGVIQSKDGTIQLAQVQGKNQLFSLDGMTLDWVDIGDTVHLVFPFVLKSLQKPLPIVLDITGKSSVLKMYDFIQSFQDNVKIEAQRVSEIQRQQQKKEAEERRLHIQQNASQIFSQTDALVQALQKKMLLNPNPKANERMSQINKKAQEVRQLAAKATLSEAENTALLEKSKLLYAEVQDFENWLGVEDLIGQKESAIDLSRQSEKLLNQMEKIYQQNPRSVVMANLIVNARQVRQEIQNSANKLEKTKTESDVLNLISSIKEDFLKLQKAADYMEKLNDTLLRKK